MKKETNPGKPNVSYINGKAVGAGYSAGRSPQSRRPAPAPGTNTRNNTSARPQSGPSKAAETVNRSSSSEQSTGVHHSSSTHTHSSSSRHRSHRRKQSAIKKFFRNYGLTAAALAGVVVVLAVVLVLSLNGRGSGTAEGRSILLLPKE